MLATLLAALDQTIVATALPQIVADLDGFEHLSWVVTAYLVTVIVTVPLYGKLSDLYGRRRLLVVSISIFLIGSALCGVAQSMEQLVAFRALQGLGAGGLIPLSQAAVADLFAPRERGRYQGYISGMWASAAVAGPLVGGTLTDLASWRLIFYVNLPLGLVALLVVVRTMPASRRPGTHRIDYTGAVTLAAAITCLLLACAWGGTTFPWTSAEVVGTAAACVVLLGLFGVIERRASEPMLPLGLFSIKTIAVSSAAAFVIGAVLFAVTIYIPVFAQGVLGASATTSGVILIPLSLGWTTASIVSGQLIARTGRYRVFPILGSTLLVIGSLLLTQLEPGTSRLALAAQLAIIGAGMGVMFQTYVLASQSAVAVDRVGVATSTLHFFRSIGGSLAVAALGAVVTARLATELPERLGASAAALDPERLLRSDARIPAPLIDETRAALASSIDTAFLIVVALAAIALVLSLALDERPLRRSLAPSSPIPTGNTACVEPS
jgi:EmrB/QacA subfamily drug resistance transporter